MTRPDGLVAMLDNTVPSDGEAARYINHVETLRDPSHHWEHSLEEWVGFFESAGLSLVTAEAFRKPIGFDSWADRMDAPLGAKARLRELLWNAPPAVREWYTPAGEGAGLKFYARFSRDPARAGQPPA